ncbi:serine/threonine-protein kinase [Kibdelosporangium aridum]|uniref:non-specific serine/threonine protein kinase n=1 Tax=Kibdelosporangium aridum TaxID=2030 RepID=A0A1Y5XZS0_KIBAR|nr:serine/threonine-protein kinase [Kibdelosporangium aridum]SMD22671.1 Serine/threonine protein kinase [Kibdelosporangium aridum]
MDDDDRLIAGRYRLAAKLGRGGMGVVWQAYDERLHRKVAVKRLLMPAELTGSQAEEAMRRATREGRIAAKLQHRNAVAVYDVDHEDGYSYLIMEYLPSRSLSQVLAERGPLSVGETADIGIQVADALDSAHRAGVVHRDVKPGNILLGHDGTVKITDFGISRAVEEVGATTSGLVVGTPAYLSPEIAKGEHATFSSDVYSLGATLYAALEGTPPSGASDNAMALLHRVASGEVTAPTQAGPLTPLLTRMLSLDPSQRPTMAEVRDALTALRSAPPMTVAAVTVEPQSTMPADEPDAVTERVEPEPPEPRPARRRVALLVAGGLVILAGAVLAVLLTQDRENTPNAAPPPATSSAASSAISVSTRPFASTTLSGTPPPATSQAPATNPAPNDGPSALSTVITEYYALMPGNLQEGWNRLTPKYQQSPAGGRGGYQTFWNRIRSARTSGVTPVGANVVEATVEYNFKDGKVVRERHRYVLVSAEGRWKIDQSTVLSSQTF